MFTINLPNEVVLLILDRLSRPDLLSLHAVNKRLFDLTDWEYLRRLFRKSTIAISSQSLHRLSAIAASDRTRMRVHSLRILCLHAPPDPGPDDQELIKSLDSERRQEVLWWNTPECRALHEAQRALLASGKAAACLINALNQLPACHTVDVVQDSMYELHDELNLLHSFQPGWLWRDRARGWFSATTVLRDPSYQEFIQKVAGTVLEAIRLSSQDIGHLRLEASLGLAHNLANPIAPVIGAVDGEENGGSGPHIYVHSDQSSDAPRDSTSQSSGPLSGVTELELRLIRVKYSHRFRDRTIPPKTLSDLLSHFGALRYLSIDLTDPYRQPRLDTEFRRARIGPTVSHLKLCGMRVGPDGLIRLLQQHPNLRHLYLYRVRCVFRNEPTKWHVFLGAVRDLVDPEMQLLEIEACTLRAAEEKRPRDISLLWEKDEEANGQEEGLTSSNSCDCDPKLRQLDETVIRERERLCGKCTKGLQDSIIIRPSLSSSSSMSRPVKVFNKVSGSEHHYHRGCQRQFSRQSTESTKSKDATAGVEEEDTEAAQNLSQIDLSAHSQLQPQPKREIESADRETVDKVTFAQAVNEALRRLHLVHNKPSPRLGDAGARQLVYDQPVLHTSCGL